MKVSRERAAENRERVLDVASRLFREKGIDGIGVAKLMQEAGLTHGGFYGSFASKAALAAEACERAGQQSVRRWRRIIDGARGRGEDPYAALVAAYLSPAHRDNPGQGCMFTTLAAEAPRHEPELRQALGTNLQDLLELLREVAPGEDAASRDTRAQTTLSTMVGALMLARALPDEAESGRLLATARASLLAGHGGAER